jgi:hypothetical protein
MKNQNLIILALVAGIGYYFYTQKKKETESTEPNDNEAPPPRERVLPPVPKAIIPYLYNPDTTIKPVAITLDRLQSIFKPAANVPFTLNPSAKKVKKAAKRKKLGELGAGYLYV